jgi:hypothetical protein
MTNERRYVVLRHEGIANPHFDFMCENGAGSLLTLRYQTWPPEDPQIFDRLPDHRIDYLTYEGPVSNNRGFVSRIAQGACTVDGETVRLYTGLIIQVGNKKGAAENSRQSAAPREGGSLHL